MKKSELKELIKECLVEESKAPETYCVLKLMTSGNNYGSIGDKRVNRVAGLKGIKHIYDAKDTLTYTSKEEAKAHAGKANAATRERRKEEAKGMSTPGMKVKAKDLPLYLWKVAEVTNGEFTGK
jgi:hypothetical protein